MSDTIEKPKLSDDLEDYKGKWVNLAITTKGSFKGLGVHDTEEIAKGHAETWTKENQEIRNRTGKSIGLVDINGLYIYTWPDHQLALIQMPVGKDND